MEEKWASYGTCSRCDATHEVISAARTHVTRRKGQKAVKQHSSPGSEIVCPPRTTVENSSLSPQILKTVGALVRPIKLDLYPLALGQTLFGDFPAGQPTPLNGRGSMLPRSCYAYKESPDA